MTKIVIDRPPSPLPPLASPARKWVPQAEWAKRAAERAPEAYGSETDAFEQVIRKLLFWKGER